MRKYYSVLLPVTVILLLVVIACKKSNPPVAIPIPPTISNISPLTGPAGTTVTISGSHFGATPADNTVKFNGVVASITSASAGTLVVTAPVAGTTGPISVSTTDGSVTGSSFTYIVPPPPPSITSISPVTGAAGTLVTINGTNFKTIAANNTVKFNGTAAIVQTATASALTVLAPAGATTGAVTVATADGTATGPVFTYKISADIYVVGSSNLGPAYWKNGVISTMPSDCAVAKAIFVDGTDDYIAGVDIANAPKYWKNGVGVSLPMSSGHNGGQATSIYVSGTDIYVGGFDVTNGAYALPRCWKNGVALPVSLSTGNISAGLPVVLGVVYGVFVSGSDIYLSGSQAPSSGNQVATYWKNGTPVALTDGSTVAEATGITVVGTDAYISGYIQGTGQRVYWKNATAVPLNTPNNTYSFVGRSVYVAPNADVYICGEFSNLAKFWKNGVMTDLSTTSPGPSTYESAFSITGNGSDIYIAGSAVGSGTGYWKNGTFTSLPNAQFVYGIVVK